MTDCFCTVQRSNSASFDSGFVWTAVPGGVGLHINVIISICDTQSMWREKGLTVTKHRFPTFCIPCVLLVVKFMIGVGNNDSWYWCLV